MARGTMHAPKPDDQRRRRRPVSQYRRTALPAAVAGRPARIPCRTVRALGLRAVPLWPALLPTDAPHRVARLAARLRSAYDHGGDDGLADQLAHEIRTVAHGRAMYDEERRAVLPWTRYTHAEAVTAWRAVAVAEEWSRPPG